MKKNCLIAGCAGLAMAAVAMAAPPSAPQSLQAGAKIDPIRIATCKFVNGKAVRTSEWMPYTGSSTRGASTYAFDAYDGDPDVPTDGLPCADIPVGSRWYFGTGYINPNTVEDLTNVADGFDGALVDDINLTFYWNPVSGTQDCNIVFGFFEETINDTDCSQPDLGDFTATGGGVILGYGDVPTGAGYYYSNVTDLITNGIEVPLPGDDSGSYIMQLLSDIGGGEPEIDPTIRTQPMLWGTADAGGTPGRVGTQHALSLDDDGGAAGGGPDGTFAEDECYDYLAGVCPDPLAKCNGFLVLGGGCTGSADYNANGFIEGGDFDQFVLDFEAGCTAANDPCPTGCNCGGNSSGDPCFCTGNADYNGNGFVEGGDFDAFVPDYEAGCI